MIINKDIVYICCLILIIVNCVLDLKTKLPFYTKNWFFRLLYLTCMVVILYYNIYIGFFIALIYLGINSKITNKN